MCEPNGGDLEEQELSRVPLADAIARRLADKIRHLASAAALDLAVSRFRDAR